MKYYLIATKESEIGVLERGSVYSDASELSIKNNRIELIEEGAFDASVRKFDFIGEPTCGYTIVSGYIDNLS